MLITSLMAGLTCIYYLSNVYMCEANYESNGWLALLAYIRYLSNICKALNLFGFYFYLCNTLAVILNLPDFICNTHG